MLQCAYNHFVVRVLARLLLQVVAPVAFSPRRCCTSTSLSSRSRANIFDDLSMTRREFSRPARIDCMIGHNLVSAGIPRWPDDKLFPHLPCLNSSMLQLAPRVLNEYVPANSKNPRFTISMHSTTSTAVY